MQKNASFVSIPHTQKIHYSLMCSFAAGGLLSVTSSTALRDS
jgi:hypothetical protein